MTTTDQLLIHLIKVVQTQSAFTAIGIGLLAQNDVEALATFGALAENAMNEEKEFKAFVEHIS